MGRIRSQEVDLINLTHIHQQLELQHQAQDTMIADLKAQLKSRDDQLGQSARRIQQLEDQVTTLLRMPCLHPPPTTAPRGLDPYSTRAAPPLLLPKAESEGSVEVKPMRTDITQFGGSETAPICLDDDSTEEDPEPKLYYGTDTETESTFQITFVGGPSAHHSTPEADLSRGHHRQLPPPALQDSWSSSLQEVMSQQTQLLQMLANNQGGRNNSAYGEFMRARPPTFVGSEEPMEAEDCLRIIEKKLTLVRAHNGDKVIFATNQLEGTASDWWDTYKAARTDDVLEPDWEEFVTTFRENYVPAAVTRMKKNEFRRLLQGNMGLQEYLNKFT
uniref:Retrotransposon gag domain-containing protein n=1 Tax=Oryza brachyantha TaxID=4533 RepID=J3LCC9_ORYBR